MPAILAPPQESDYRFLGLTNSNHLWEALGKLSQTDHRFVLNAFQRLYDVAWIARKLDDDMLHGKTVGGEESLLSLQMYLLLTCADTLGHVYVRTQGVEKRFRAFFDNLPKSTQQMLIEGLLIWEEQWTEPSQSKFWNASIGKIVQPSSRHHIEDPVLGLSDTERLKAVVDYLYYARRNAYTHEAEFPQLGFHPNLKALQMHRLRIKEAGTLGEMDRIQLHDRAGTKGKVTFCFVYMVADDPIMHLRQVIVSGLGEIIRRRAGL